MIIFTNFLFNFLYIIQVYLILNSFRYQFIARGSRCIPRGILIINPPSHWNQSFVEFKVSFNFTVIVLSFSTFNHPVNRTLKSNTIHSFIITLLHPMKSHQTSKMNIVVKRNSILARIRRRSTSIQALIDVVL